MTRRIVIVTELIAPYRIPVFNLLGQMDKIDLHVIFLSKTDPKIREWMVYEREIQFHYQVLRSGRLRGRNHSVLINAGMRKALRQALPDAIVCGGYNYPASWQSLLWARRHRVPFFLWIESNENDSRSNRRLTHFLKKRFLARCDGFIVPGQASLKYLKNFGISPQKIFTAPNAIDIDLFGRAADQCRQNRASARQRLNLPQRFFLFVGRIVEEKGVFDLLEAYRSLNPKLRIEVGLVYVGDGPDRVELARRAKDVASCAIRFPGFIQRDELPAYYALADALVFPTHSDPWGLVVNEAMASGLPIICSDVAGCAADLVEVTPGRESNGYIVPARDIERLAHALRDVAENPENRRRMGHNSKERIARYSPLACAQGIAQAVMSLQGEA